MKRVQDSLKPVEKEDDVTHTKDVICTFIYTLIGAIPLENI